jgi:K+-transporting ATPase ATPase A chain
MLTELAYVAFLMVAILSLAAPTGRYIARVFSGEETWLSPLIRPIELWLYRITGIDETKEMSWKTYALSVVFINILGILALFLLQELQGFLPLNPQGLGAVPWDTALNTAISFTTNTNWQSYSGEQTMSYLT